MISQDLQLIESKKILEQGGLVAIPTETVYGLAANAFDEPAIKKIFEAKSRPLCDPLIVHCHSIQKVKEIVVDFPPILENLAKMFWPGPLTILLQKKSLISDLVTANQTLVAIRIPNHPLTLSLLESLDFPLVAPSANPFGYVSPTTAQHVMEQLGNKIDLILDGGPCRVGLESTIISLDENNNLFIHRPGGISQEQIFDQTNIMPILLQRVDKEKILPGTLEHHYAPKKRLLLGNIRENYLTYCDKKVGIILFSNDDKHLFPNCIVKPLSFNNFLDEAAQNLFRVLREMDHEDIDIILAEKVPNHGIGVAINDRLTRASANK